MTTVEGERQKMGLATCNEAVAEQVSEQFGGDKSTALFPLRRARTDDKDLFNANLYYYCLNLATFIWYICDRIHNNICCSCFNLIIMNSLNYKTAAITGTKKRKRDSKLTVGSQTNTPSSLNFF